MNLSNRYLDEFMEEHKNNIAEDPGIIEEDTEMNITSEQAEVEDVVKKSTTPHIYSRPLKKQKRKMGTKEFLSYLLVVATIVTGLSVVGKKIIDKIFPKGVPSFSEVNGDYSDKLEHVLILKAASEIKSRYSINKYYSNPNNEDDFYYMPGKFVPKMVADGLSVRDIAYFTYITTGYTNVAEEAVNQAVVWYKNRGITVTDEKVAEALETISDDDKRDEYNQYFASEYHDSKDIAGYIGTHKAEIVHTDNKGGNK